VALNSVKNAVNDKRPVNLDIATISLPITAYASILHRVSGVVIVAGVGILLCLLDSSLASEADFKTVQGYLDSFFVKLIVWGVLAGLIYHTVAGTRHLIQDLGIGESLEGGVKGAQITFGLSAVLIFLAGWWVW
jgi:succinate dehydrogenase / fumarate reductase cytochrome b subunit